jgi:hypothetical protein
MDIDARIRHAASRNSRRTMRPFIYWLVGLGLSVATVHCESAHADLPDDAGPDTASVSSSSSGSSGGGDDSTVASDDASEDSATPSEGGEGGEGGVTEGVEGGEGGGSSDGGEGG